ncbi:MAG: HNH endonuclease [Sulfuricurvum sp.]|uniref:HNH endonuclease n=1 Tax=Sulfuricurvum sp. TaxID=2025608 RepID=UPI00261192F8|nr:HNH endonuclease [Sulfuricurvum sp.]MDD2369315.1 HNH endonuclease [Sulfuricurvum sp.]MDD2950002.1 HNH endonuclease [Sulfuricurvum sp.]MDD5118709.1 HNH endonuclease [Sulfuricurvum sp.]
MLEEIKGIILQPLSGKKYSWSNYNSDRDEFLTFFQDIITNEIGEYFNVNHNTEDLSGYLLIPYSKQKKCFGAYYLNAGKKLSNNPDFEWAYHIDHSKSYNFVKEVSQRDLIEEAKNYEPEFEKQHDGNPSLFHYRLDGLSNDYRKYINKLLLNTNDYPEGTEKPCKYEIKITQIHRDSKIKEWVLNEANGVCECCNEPAPFEKDDGFPYLEIHHLKMLANDGSDTVANAIAVCPNCHRELHHGTNKQTKLDNIYSKISRLKKEDNKTS